MIPNPKSLFTGHKTAIGLPRWVADSCSEDIESATFSAGAALMKLDMMLRGADDLFPTALLCDRLALRSALACLAIEGRAETDSAVRDAVCLTRDGDGLGPAGDAFAFWRRTARLDLRSSDWAERLMRLLPERQRQTIGIADLTNGMSGSPLSQAVAVLEQALRASPRQEALALLLADCALARGLGWARPVPLVAPHLTRRALRSVARGEGGALHIVCNALVAASNAALGLGAQLHRDAGKLHAIQPKLRSKAATQALTVFLTCDAVSPSGMLSPVIQGTATAMSDRAARRLCDRLVDLGAVRELTGRPSFRLYGL